MTPPDRRSVLALACSAVAVGSLAAGCGQPKAAPFDPAALHQAELAAADQTQFRRLPAPQTAPRDERGFLDVRTLVAQDNATAGADTGFSRAGAATRPATQPGEPIVLLPLSEAIQRAALNNFDVAVAAYEPGIEATRAIEADARFDPTFRQQLEGRYADQQIAGQLVDSTSIVTDLQRVYSSSTSLTQALSAGGEASLSYNVTYLDSPTNFARGLTTLEETVESAVVLRLTQPLLRDFGGDVNRARLVIAQNSRRISILDFRRELEETLTTVEEAYWQLYRANREVEIQTDLLAQTQRTADLIAKRLGTDANNGSVAQAVKFVAEARASLIQAEAAAANLSNRLKLLLNDPDLPISGDARVQPTTSPIDAPLLFDFADSLETALLLRPEIGSQLVRVESATTALRVGRNNVLPRFDVVVEAGFQGLDDDYGQAVSNQFEFDSITAGLGFQFEVPLGNRAARAVERRALLQRMQAMVQYRALINQITFELKQAQQDVSSQYAGLLERRRAVDAAFEAVRVEEAREEQVALTPDFSDRKLRFLRELAQARGAEAGALAEYNASLADYERAKGTLLRYNNIVLSEAGQASGDDLPIGRPMGR